MIQIKNLNKSYKNHKVLENISLDIPTSGVFALLGLNGAGKTTLISILCNITKFDSGEVLYDGLPFFDIFKENHSLCSLTPQDFAFYPTLSVYENLQFFSKLNTLSLQKQNEMIDFAMHINKLENYLHSKSANLSGGLKRRLNFAIGLLNDPKILFLDEPTVGIDPQSRTFILNSIKELANNKKLIFYTSHYMNEVDFLADEIAVIDDGKILSTFKKEDKKSILTLKMKNGFSEQDTRLLSSFSSFNKVSDEMQGEDFDYEKFLSFIDFAKQNKLIFDDISLSLMSTEAIFLSLTGKGMR